jgi:hypothetical protein
MKNLLKTNQNLSQNNQNNLKEVIQELKKIKSKVNQQNFQ